MSNLGQVKPASEAVEGTASDQAQFDERKFNAAFAESVCNDTVINWRYWVEQMPRISAAEAARLMCALDPDLFKSLDHRPNKNDPSDLCRKAEIIQRLAERQGKQTASPADWLAWAGEQKIKVHDGFRIEVESLPALETQVSPAQNTATPAPVVPDEIDFTMVATRKDTESQKLKWELWAPQNITEADLKEQKLSALTAQLDALQKQIDAPYSEICNTVPEPQAVPVAVGASGVIHSTKTRRDALTPVIEFAQSQCLNPQDAAEVWGKLQVLANNKHAPFLRTADGGLDYLHKDSVKVFTRDALGKRKAVKRR